MAERPVRWAARVGSQTCTITRALLACVSLAGCVAFHEPLSEGASRVIATPPSDLSSLTVLVRHPEINDPLPVDYPAWSRLAPADVLEFRTSNSDHIVESLSSIDIFAAVQYDTGERVRESVLIEPLIPPPGGYCDGQDIFLPFLTLGIVPAICERDRGVYFRVIGRKLPDFACRWPQSEMVGWFPVLLASGLGSWSREANQQAFLAHLEACIESQAEAFATDGSRLP